MSEEKRVATAEILNTSVHVSVKLNDRYQGPPGPPGKDGNVRFEDLTEAQIEQLRGPQGLTGKTPQITVQVETGEPGTEASVMQSGTAEAPVIALTIPRGNVGATPQITVQVKTGEPGTAASVKQTGTAEAPVIELTIPRGDTGNIGSLTINGKTPDSAGKVMLTAADVGAISADELNQLKSEKANKAIISDAWQSGKTYNAGTYCIYNDSLYKALVQTTAEPTSASDWKNVCITDELKPIRIKRIIGTTDSAGDVSADLDNRSVILSASCDRQAEGCYTGFMSITPTLSHNNGTYIWWAKCIDDNGVILANTKVCIDVFYMDM